VWLFGLREKWRDLSEKFMEDVWDVIDILIFLMDKIVKLQILPMIKNN